ncbi:MAG: NADH-quinone oxidoreductase subunit M [Planctomycetia bacterium]|jgi:NADH-quinone oxidoreductase subunit M
MAHLLLVTLILPVVAIVLVGGSRERARWTAAIAVTVNLILVGVVSFSFPSRSLDDFAVFDVPWISGTSAIPEIRFSIGLDGLSIWLYAISALLSFVAVLISWKAIQRQTTAFYRLLLLLETGMIGVFLARDVILFYIFFEFTLIPLFFLIGVWGSEERRRAAIKFFLFTLTGSLLTFLGLLALVYYGGSLGIGKATFSIPELTERLMAQPPSHLFQHVTFWALFIGFAIKVPMVPLHTWLPLAHVQAPAAGSVDLAGVLLKIGLYGFIRFAIPMLPDAVAVYAPWLLGLSVVAIIYGALVALAQPDMKRMIAYSSISHMGFCTLGLFALDQLGGEGAILQMINHGLSTGGLFALVGMIYERYHTRQIDQFGGLARRLPWLAMLMLFMTLASIGMPGLNGFVGEFLILAGTFCRAWSDGTIVMQTWAVIAVLGVVLGAWYMLRMIRRVFFGPLKEPKVKPSDHGEEAADHKISDLSWREIGAMAPLVVIIVWIGVWPQFFLDRMSPKFGELTKPAMERRWKIEHKEDKAGPKDIKQPELKEEENILYRPGMPPVELGPGHR